MKIYCPKCKEIFPVQPPADGQKEIDCPRCGAKIDYPSGPTAPGTVVGDFLIEREISRGGMGEVYLARQLSLDRPVALKVLQDRFVNDKEYVDSLTREARAAAKINHPNIVQAYAVGEEDGVFYFAMEFIRGETLKQILKREKKLDFNQAAKIIQEIAGALDVAWREQKLVHQDIKPDNIMLDANGFAKLADLGLARTAGVNDKDEEVGDEVMGTPQYISPEQLTGVPTDVRSDIYSLGATFYQFVTGRFPYVADTAEEIAKMHVAGKLTPPKEINPELPDELNAIIIKMMARNIEDRYQTPVPLIKALELFQQNRRSSATGGVPALNLKLGGKSGSSAPVFQLPKVKGGVAAPTLAKPAPKPVPVQPSMPLKPKPSTPVVPKSIVKPIPPKPIVKPVEKPIVPEVKTAEPEAKMTEKVAEPEVKVADISVKEPSLPLKTPDPEIKIVEKTTEDEDEIVGLKGEAATEENAAEKKPKKAKKERKPRTPMSGRTKKLLIFLIVLLVIVLGVGGGFYTLAKMGKLPEAAKPYGEKLLVGIDDLLVRLKPVPAEKPEPSPLPKTAPVAQTPPPPAPVKEQAPPPPPPKPTTRPEYLAGVESTLRIIRNNPEMRDEFLTAGDQFFMLFPQPVTPEERAAVEPLWTVYGRMDEVRRAAPARAEARRRHDAALAERRQKQQQQQSDDAERKEAERLQREKLAEDTRKLAEESRAREAELQRQIAERTVEVRKAVDAYSAALYQGFFRQVFQGEMEPLRVAVTAAGTYKLGYENNSPGEKALAERLKSTTSAIRAEAERLRQILTVLESVSEKKNGFNVELPQNELVRVICAVPGKVAYRNDAGELVLLPMSNPGVYRTYMHRVASRLKLKLTDFEYAFLAQEFPMAAKLLPNDFWKQNWAPMMTAYFREVWKSASPELRQSLEKRYGEMAEFKAARE